MNILQLSSEVIDQIAAGEVVERPAHLIKELVENSLDAGATELEIEVDDGGRSVSVTDNGRGIDASELPLALARHATSKIQNTTDLWALRSFGFRGEALASIASVSHLTLTSRTEAATAASRLECKFGKISETGTSGGVQGTRIQIRELFANNPAPNGPVQKSKFVATDERYL